MSAVHVENKEGVRKMKKIAFMGMMVAAGAAFAANVTDVDDNS